MSARELEGRARAARYEEAFAAQERPVEYQQQYRPRAFDAEAYETWKSGGVDKVEPRDWSGYGRYLRNKIPMVSMPSLPSLPTTERTKKALAQKQEELRKQRGLARAEQYNKDYAERTPVYGSRVEEYEPLAKDYKPRISSIKPTTRAQEYDEAYPPSPQGFGSRRLEDARNAWQAAKSWLGNKASAAGSSIGSYFSRGQQPDYRENAAGEYNEVDERAYAEFIERQRLEDQARIARMQGAQRQNHYRAMDRFAEY